LAILQLVVSTRLSRQGLAVAVFAALWIASHLAAAEPVAASSTGLRGPLPSIADFCRTLPRGQRCYGAADAENAPRRAKTLLIPYRGVEAFVAGAVDGKKLYVAIQLTDGWFIYESPNQSIGDISNLGLVVRKEPEGRALIVSRSIQSWLSTDDADRREFEHCTEYLTLCGVGPSGKPTCMDPLAVAGGLCDANERKATKWSWRLKERFVGQALELKAVGKIGEVDGQAAVGRHAFDFR
jgi:hypothetical protein